MLVDHFKSRIKGRTFKSFGRNTSENFFGYCVFVDHISGYIQVEHQLGLSSTEKVRAKKLYEKYYLDYGIMVHTYLADNGVFNANVFISHISEHAQLLRFCSTLIVKIKL